MSCDGFSVPSWWSLDLGGEIGIKSSRGGDLCLLERPSIFTWKMCRGQRLLAGRTFLADVHELGYEMNSDGSRQPLLKTDIQKNLSYADPKTSDLRD